MGGFRVGSVFGIPIEINASWLIVFGLILWSLSAGVFPALYPDLTTATHWIMGSTTTVLFFASLLAHELSHSLVSMRHGMKVRRIVLFIFGGLSESTQEMPSAKVEFQVAIAGPIMSFAIGGLAALGAVALEAAGPAAIPVLGVLQWLAIVNIALGIFNLLPGFPLDGGRVLRAAAWHFTGSLRRATRIAARGGQIIGGLLIAWGVFRLLSGDLIGALWVGFIGFLLFQAASSSYGELIIRKALERVGVGDIMSREPVTVDPDMTLREVVDDMMLRLPYGGYPVTDGRLHGVLQANAVKEIPTEDWPKIRVSQVMIPIGEADALSPDQPVAEALDRFTRLGVGRLPVLNEQGEVVGVLSQTDIFRWINWHPEALER